MIKFILQRVFLLACSGPSAQLLNGAYPECRQRLSWHHCLDRVRISGRVVGPAVPERCEISRPWGSLRRDAPFAPGFPSPRVSSGFWAVAVFSAVIPASTVSTPVCSRKMSLLPVSWSPVLNLWRSFSPRSATSQFKGARNAPSGQCLIRWFGLPHRKQRRV